MSDIPSWWEAVLLAGAAFRIWRLLGVDSILDPWRDRVVKADKAREYRQTLDEFLHCPWCLGFWSCWAWWCAWLVFPHGAVFVAVPFALSTAVGLLGKLDG